MAVPLGVSINYEQWQMSPTAFNVIDPFLINLHYALDLTLTGLTNLIFADDAGTANMSVLMTPAAIHAYEGAPNPGPGTTAWRKAQEQAIMLKGGSYYGNPLNAFSERKEGRPTNITAGELIGL